MKLKPHLNSADIELLKKNFLTKKEAKALLTKKDAENTFLTKQDAKDTFATKQELATFKEEIIESQNQKIDELKNEWYTKIDPVPKEVMTARNEQAMLNARLEKVEHKLQD